MGVEWPSGGWLWLVHRQQNRGGVRIRVRGGGLGGSTWDLVDAGGFATVYGGGVCVVHVCVAPWGECHGRA
jgi:hypothetical protein